MLPFQKTIIIIPTYNEIDNIEKMVSAIFDVSADLTILVVDDGSPDGTSDKIKELQANFSKLHLIQREKKLGLGTAYVAGFKWALEGDYDYFFEMDCDFSHDPKEIPNFLKNTKDYDLVIGSRYVSGIRVINWPLERLMLSLAASFYTRTITKLPLKDTTGGFKCFTRRALESVDLSKVIFKGYAFQIELNYKVWSKGFRLKEIPIIFYERRNGASKMNRSLIFEALFGVFKLRIKRLFKTL